MSFDVRYERHIELREIGASGQKKLKQSNILIVGAGGLGCPVALYLTAAGIGKITIVDDDKISLTNLQRQILYKTQDCGKPKASRAATYLDELNPEIKIIAHTAHLDEKSAPDLIQGHDLVIDCTDNFETRYLLNRLCVSLKKTLISGSVIYFDGQVCVFKDGSPCYQCLYPHSPNPQQAPTCTESAVLGPLPGVIGTIMAAEAIKELLSIGESLAGYVLSYSALHSDFRKISIEKRKNCTVCG